MNNQLQEFARAQLKLGLNQLPEFNQNLFKKMYNNGDHSKPIGIVVDDMSEDKLDWAMQQVQRTLDKR